MFSIAMCLNLQILQGLFVSYSLSMDRSPCSTNWSGKSIGLCVGRLSRCVIDNGERRRIGYRLRCGQYLIGLGCGWGSLGCNNSRCGYNMLIWDSWLRLGNLASIDFWLKV